jgi:hypothetical protein
MRHDRQHTGRLALRPADRGKKWEYLRIFEGVPFPVRDINQRKPSGIGGAADARRKLLMNRLLRCRIRQIPGALEPRVWVLESPCDVPEFIATSHFPARLISNASAVVARATFHGMSTALRTSSDLSIMTDF